MIFPYTHHVFVCQNQRAADHAFGCCQRKGSEEILAYIKKRVRELQIPQLCISKSGCLGECLKGPVVVVYPEGVWYTLTSLDDAEKMIQSHLIQHRPVEEFKINAD